ncbi:MAG: TonB-dependent receptor [Acidobacteriota bacterium]|nr:TonB-dependent receptor [Acidobacteriota bacterium]
MARLLTTARRLSVVVSSVITLTLLLLLTGTCSYAQVDEGAITGTVTDTTGAVIPNADVTLLNTDQGITLQTKTSGTGLYTFSPVRIGHYQITVKAQGFATTTQKNLTVNVAQVLQVPVSLKLGTASETVEVSTAPPQLQTQEASVGQVIGQHEVNALPLNGRNFTFLAQLGAGAQTPQEDGRGNAASGAFSANGLRPAQNNYLLDGIDNNSAAVDFLNGTNYVILPPVDAIQEFKVQTADFSAELGRAAGAVLNATIKSGTNSIHGAVWEFLRNDKFDAADYFENNGGIKKGKYRQNQFGASIGGPIIRNKVFFFGDYEGFRRVQGTVQNPNVPTLNERQSNYQDLSDILALNSGTQQDALGRTLPKGTVLDPATTRYVAHGAVDPVSGLTNNDPDGQAHYVRDPFGTCGASTTTFTQAACNLNQLPNARIDQNAVALLNLYPAPNSGLQTYAVSPSLFEHRNQFDIRGDVNPNEKNQIFVRFSYADDPQYIPGPFGGVADGGGFAQGNQSAKSAQGVAGFTHVFSPSTVNQARVGIAHLHTTRFGPLGSDSSDIPAKFGIQGIPQGQGNGGLPAFGIGGLQQLGGNAFLPSDEVTATIQVTDDFTRIYGNHSFKMGIQYQHLKFSTLQPAWSHGQFNYGGGFTDIPGASVTTGGIAQFLLPPTAATTPVAQGGFNYSGGADGVYASNINKTYDERMYFATYFQDDWKVTPKLTLNLGVRWDFFGPINETNGGQANFVPWAIPDRGFGGPTFIIPASGKDNRTLSTNSTCAGIGCWGFTDLLAADGIQLMSTNRYGQGLTSVQKNNFAPRIGGAYQITPRLVARAGFGLFFNAFENQGYGPNIGENYPFVYNLSYFPSADPSGTSIDSQVAPISYNSPYANCTSSGPGGTASFESGFSCIPLTPTAVNALGVGLQGLQFNFQTPRTYSANVTMQYALTHNMSLQVGYVFTHGANLQEGVGTHQVSQILPYGISTGLGCPYGTYTTLKDPTRKSCVPWPDFGGGSFHGTFGQSSYHGLQATLEQRYANGLNFLLAYTWSKTLSDAGDLLNGGNISGLRAFGIPGLGPKFDWAPADFDVRNVIHFSGGYELPFGAGKRFMNHNGPINVVFGNWSANWVATLQGGQPMGVGCKTGTASGAGCYAVLVKGQSLKKGVKVKNVDGGPHPFWLDNPAAFNQPCQLVDDGSGNIVPGNAPTGCIPLSGAAALGSKTGQVYGPGYHRLDFSVFKQIPINERFHMEFRSEFFNILNHPNFSGGINRNYNDTTHFGEITHTRDAPNDPRQIQFALKLYY